MRAYIVLCSILLLTACTNSTKSTEGLASSWEHINREGAGSITLAYVPSDGFSYTDEAGNLTGVTIELIRDFVEYTRSEHEVNIDIHYNPIERFSEFYEYVKTAEAGVFGVANVTITEERKSELAFSPPYMTNIATLITHNDVEEIESFEEISSAFSGLNALAFEGTLHEERLMNIVENHLPEADIFFAHSNSEIIARTAAGNETFAYVDIYNYWRAVEQGEPLLRHAAGDEASEQFGVIMPLESDWHPLMAEFLESGGGYIHSDRYRQLMETHLGQELAELLLRPN